MSRTVVWQKTLTSLISLTYRSFVDRFRLKDALIAEDAEDAEKNKLLNMGSWAVVFTRGCLIYGLVHPGQTGAVSEA